MEPVGFALGVLASVQSAVHIAEKVRVSLQKETASSELASEIKICLQRIDEYLSRSARTARAGEGDHEKRWLRAWERHEVAFQDIQTGLDKIEEEKRERRKILKRLPLTRDTHDRLIVLHANVQSLERDLHVDSYFNAVLKESAETRGEVSEIRKMLACFVPYMNALKEGTSTSSVYFSDAPRPPLSKAALKRGLEAALDGTVDGGWKVVASSFADGTNIIAADKKNTTTSVQEGATDGEPGDYPIEVHDEREASSSEEEVKMMEEKMETFLHKLSHQSSMSEEEKVVTKNMIDTLWNLWRDASVDTLSDRYDGDRSNAFQNKWIQKENGEVYFLRFINEAHETLVASREDRVQKREDNLTKRENNLTQRENNLTSRENAVFKREENVGKREENV